MKINNETVKRGERKEKEKGTEIKLKINEKKKMDGNEEEDKKMLIRIRKEEISGVIHGREEKERRNKRRERRL